MKKFALPALAAALALAACADSTPDADAETTAASDTSAAMEPAPMATETTVVTTPGATMTTNANGDKVTIGPDGVKADVGDADTRVKVDTKNDTLTVED